jgi:hypothetical protein
VLFSTIFAFGEIYCFAVILPLAGQLYCPSGRLEGEYNITADEVSNITVSEANNITADKVSNITEVKG